MFLYKGMNGNNDGSHIGRPVEGGVLNVSVELLPVVHVSLWEEQVSCVLSLQDTRHKSLFERFRAARCGRSDFFDLGY